MALPQALAKWWRGWTEGNRFEDCTEWDVERMANDTGVSPIELRRLANLGEDSADLLVQRMAALDLDRGEVSAAVPKTLQLVKYFGLGRHVNRASAAALRRCRREWQSCRFH